MGQVLVDSNSLTAIAEAIRSKNKKVIKYKPNEMAGAIKALALDNSVVIQSNDAWKYAIDSTLEHQSITVKVSGKLTGDNNTGYKGEVIFEPYITSNFGWLAGKIKQTVDYTNHIITFSAEAATEISGMLQDGWTPVYIVNNNYYTTTTPDDVNSFKSVSSSDNIENILICGYYTKDNSTGKLSPVDSDKNYVGKQLVSTYTKKIKNTYATSIGDNAFDSCNKLTSVDLPNATSIGWYAFRDCHSLSNINLSNATSIGEKVFDGCSALTSIDLSNATRIGNFAFDFCSALTSIDLSNATGIGSFAFRGCDKLKYIVIDNNTVSKAHINPPPTDEKVLIPQSMMDTYSSDSYWSKYKSQLDAIENYTITRENGQITVTKKN